MPEYTELSAPGAGRAHVPGADPYRNPYAFAVRQVGRLPEASWYVGRGTMPIERIGQVNTSPGPMTPMWQPVTTWLATRNWRPIQFSPKLGARASLMGYGFPSTWFTLRLPLAQPDLQTALSKRYKPVISKFQATGGAPFRIPGAFVPIRPTGPANYTGGAGRGQ